MTDRAEPGVTPLTAAAKEVTRALNLLGIHGDQSNADYGLMIAHYLLDTGLDPWGTAWLRDHAATPRAGLTERKGADRAEPEVTPLTERQIGALRRLIAGTLDEDAARVLRTLFDDASAYADIREAILSALALDETPRHADWCLFRRSSEGGSCDCGFDAPKAVLRAALASGTGEPGLDDCVRNPDPGSIGSDWCVTHHGRWRFDRPRCGASTLANDKGADPTSEPK